MTRLEALAFGEAEWYLPNVTTGDVNYVDERGNVVDSDRQID